MSFSETLTLLPGIVIAMSFHEFAHAFVAYRMGDDTAARMGRLTLNPISHVDPIGLAMLLIGGFGWAKPVPVNENNYRNPKLGSFLVAIAGVTMNILVAIVTIFIAFLTAGYIHHQEYYDVMEGIVWINIAFASFNLLPIPPLDGAKLISSLLPTEWRIKYYQYEQYGFFVMVILIITNLIDYILNPVVSAVVSLISSVVGVFL